MSKKKIKSVTVKRGEVVHAAYYDSNNDRYRTFCGGEGANQSWKLMDVSNDFTCETCVKIMNSESSNMNVPDKKRNAENQKRLKNRRQSAYKIISNFLTLLEC